MKKPKGKKRIAIFIADLHWTTLIPQYRKEAGDFTHVIAKKLDVVYEYAAKHDNLPVFVAGDIFHRSRSFLDMWAFKEYMAGVFEKNPTVSFECIRGQHDLFHHNSEDTATSFNAVLTMFEGNFLALDSSSTILLSDASDERDMCIYFCGWGEDVVPPDEKDDLNILLIHKGLWRGESPYPGAEDGNVAGFSVELKELGYDIVFSGDYHKAWDARVGGVDFYNIGCFTRRDVTYADQKPRFCVLYDDGTVESVYVGEDDVFDVERSDSSKERKAVRDEFSTALALTYESKTTIQDILKNVIATKQCNDLVINERQSDMLRDVLAASGND